jgi:hypothetical protein
MSTKGWEDMDYFNSPCNTFRITVECLICNNKVEKTECIAYHEKHFDKVGCLTKYIEQKAKEEKQMKLNTIADLRAQIAKLEKSIPL